MTDFCLKLAIDRYRYLNDQYVYYERSALSPQPFQSSLKIHHLTVQFEYEEYLQIISDSKSPTSEFNG